MRAYYSDSIWGIRGYRPVNPIPVGQQFVWEDLEGTIPVIYIGNSGAILDLCIRIPLERIKQYLDKWTGEPQAEELTGEQYEQMERDSPFALDFQVGLALDNLELEAKQRSSAVWHPFENAQDRVSDEAKSLLKEYGCDTGCGWVFMRGVYHWKQDSNYVPKKMKLRFQGTRSPVTTGYFTTNGECKGEVFEVVHPVTMKKYGVTLQGMKAEKMERGSWDLLREGMEYPDCYQVLSYQVSPELTPEEFRILDCAKSDAPREVKSERECRNRGISIIGGADGPTAVFMAGKSSDPIMQAAISSLHFEPVPQVKWRMVFQVKPRSDMTAEFRIGN